MQRQELLALLQKADPDQRFAVSEGEAYPVAKDAPDNLNGLTLRQVINITRSLECDLAGHPVRVGSNFPDGHTISPFKPRLWTVMTRDEAVQYFADTPEDLSRSSREQDQSRRKKYHRQASEWFEAMGRYCVAFEHTCAALVRLVRILVKNRGLREREITDVIVADLGSQQVVTLAQTLFRSTDPADVDRRIAEEIFSRVAICQQSRNEIIHAAWLPGGANAWNADDFSVARGLRYVKKPSEGTAVRQLLYSGKDLDWLRLQCQSTTMLIEDISHSVRRPVPLSSWLVLDRTTIRRALRLSTKEDEFFVELYPRPTRYPPENNARDSSESKPEEGRTVAARILDEEDLMFEIGLYDKIKKMRDFDDTGGM